MSRFSPTPTLDLFEEMLACMRRIECRLDALEGTGGTRWLTTAEFAKARGCAVSTARELIRQGRLDAERLGRGYRIRSDSVVRDEK